MSSRIIQPQHGPYELDPAWFKKGLQLVLLQDGYVTPSGYTPYTRTGSGVAKSISPKGINPGFGSTLAGNTNSYLSGPVIRPPLTGFRSCFVRVYALSTGGGAFGRVFQDVSGVGNAVGVESVYLASGRLEYVAMSGDQAGGPGWGPTSSLPLNQWVNQSWTHDKSNTANVPEFYVNGLPVAASLIGGASSDFTTTVLSPIAIGNRPSDVARGWDGMIGPILFFDGYLSATDHWSLNSNPLQVIRSLRQTLRASVASSTTTISATTADAGGSIISKSTCKTAIAATTANAVGTVNSGLDNIRTAIAATTANAIGAINSKSTCKTAISATTANAIGAISSGLLPTTILSPVDRGNVLLSASTVADPTSTTPTLNIVPRTMVNDWIPGKSLQFHWYGAANHVNGKIPQFKVKFWTSTTHNSSTEIILQATDKPFDIAGGYRPEWSYDARTWYPFDNCLYDADNLHLRFYNNAAFTQDTVYYSTSTPWQESLTGEWLATLPTTYIQETPSVIAYGGADYVFGQSVPRVNELSEAIDACNLYAFKISSGSGLAPNGLPKKKFLLSAGNHAGEDPGNWALKGCVEFLISADARAVIARQWLDFYVYPMLIPAGRRGGHWRSDWEPGYLTYDANRHWTDSTMSTIVALKNAIIADTGGAVAGGMSFHSSFPAVTQTYIMPNEETSSWASAINTHFGSLQSPEFYDLPSSSNGWTVNSLGARASTIPEVVAKPAAALEIFGANYGKVISDLAVINYFSAGASSGFETVISATTANAVGSITSKATAKTVIAATTANSVGSIASKATSKTVVAATTANAVGAIASKATAKTAIAATTANAVGNIASSNAGVCASAITATTAGATASIISKSTCKTAVTTTTANAVGAIASKATPKTAIAATTANAVGAIASSSVAGVSTAINATTANTVGAINGYSTCKTAISATLAGVFGTVNSASQIPVTTEIYAPPDAIVTVVNKRNRVSVISRRS